MIIVEVPIYKGNKLSYTHCWQGNHDIVFISRFLHHAYNYAGKPLCKPSADPLFGLVYREAWEAAYRCAGWRVLQ